MLNDRWLDPCCRGRVFDPVSLTVGSLAATAIGGGLSAAGTLASGSAAKVAGQMQQTEANYQADQDTMNAAQALASGQRQSIADRIKSNLAVSTARANAAGSGFVASSGSPASVIAGLRQRGSYNAAMDMFNGESAETGLLNKAAAERYSGQAAEIGGEEAESASELTAMGTLASSAGSMFKTYGGYAYPQSFKST